MSTVYLLKPDAVRELMRPGGFGMAFVHGTVPGSSGDPNVRWAELADVVTALADHSEQWFIDAEDMDSALFGGVGGGLGIPLVLREFVVGHLVATAKLK